MEPAPQTEPDDDPARRFYARSHAALGARGMTATGPSVAEIASGQHRYSTAYQWLAAGAGGDVLEMGYGGHGIIELLAPLAREYHVVDIVDRADAAALPANVQTYAANLDNPFPFSDARFDTVIAMMVIEHLYDPFHAFAEVARVARPGAAVFVNLPNIASLKCRLQLLMGQMPVTSSPDWFANREWDGSHLHYFTIADVRRLAALYRLTLEEVRPVGRYLALKRLRPSLLCHEITYRFRKC